MVDITWTEYFSIYSNLLQHIHHFETDFDKDTCSVHLSVRAFPAAVEFRAVPERSADTYFPKLAVPAHQLPLECGICLVYRSGISVRADPSFIYRMGDTVNEYG